MNLTNVDGANVTQEAGPRIFTAVDICFITIFILLLFLITVGNATVILILIKKSGVSKSKNFLLLSLALADMTVGLFVIPNVLLLGYTSYDWGDVGCQMCYFMEFFSSAASVFSISALAVDRFRAIVMPFKSLNSRGHCLYITFITVWVLSLLYALRSPMVYIMENLPNGGHRCTVHPNNVAANNVLMVVDFAVLFAIPGLVLILCNLVTSIFIQTRQVVSSNVDEDMRRRRKAIRILFLMIVIFIICHLPLQALRQYILWTGKQVAAKRILGPVFFILTWINSVINLFFYQKLNANFSFPFIGTIFSKCMKLRKKRVGPAPHTTVFYKNST